MDAKHTPSGPDLVPWERAETRAKQVMTELGVQEHECSCLINPTSYGWRVTVTRYSDAAARTVRVSAATGE